METAKKLCTEGIARLSVPATGLYVKLLSCQPTSRTEELSFSMLRKLLAKNLRFSPDKVWKYLA